MGLGAWAGPGGCGAAAGGDLLALLHHSHYSHALPRTHPCGPTASRPHRPRPPRPMHAGVMGGAVADTLQGLGYPVSAWTRRPKQRPGVRCYSGTGQLRAFAQGIDVLVCLLPLTGATRCDAGGARGCGACAAASPGSAPTAASLACALRRPAGAS